VQQNQPFTGWFFVLPLFYGNVMAQWFTLFPDAVTCAEKLPVGTKTLIRAGKLRICLLHDHAAGIKAIGNACPHQGAPLHEGWLNGQGEIVCPLHDYRFSLATGEEQSGHHCPPLKHYPLRRTAEGGLEIQLPVG